MRCSTPLEFGCANFRSHWTKCLAGCRARMAPPLPHRSDSGPCEPHGGLRRGKVWGGPITPRESPLLQPSAARPYYSDSAAGPRTGRAGRADRLLFHSHVCGENRAGRRGVPALSQRVSARTAATARTDGGTLRAADDGHGGPAPRRTGRLARGKPRLPDHRFGRGMGTMVGEAAEGAGSHLGADARGQPACLEVRVSATVCGPRALHAFCRNCGTW